MMTFEQLEDAVQKFHVQKYAVDYRVRQREMPRCAKCGNQVLLHTSGNGFTMCDSVYQILLARAETAAEQIGCLANVLTHFYGMAIYRAPCYDLFAGSNADQAKLLHDHYTALGYVDLCDGPGMHYGKIEAVED